MLRKADVARLGSERLQRVGIFHDDDLTVKVGLNVTIERPDNAFRWPAIGLCGLVRWPIGDGGESSTTNLGKLIHRQHTGQRIPYSGYT